MVMVVVADEKRRDEGKEGEGRGLYIILQARLA